VEKLTNAHTSGSTMRYFKVVDFAGFLLVFFSIPTPLLEAFLTVFVSLLTLVGTGHARRHQIE
jgi:hypothetical protein